MLNTYTCAVHVPYFIDDYDSSSSAPSIDLPSFSDDSITDPTFSADVLKALVRIVTNISLMLLLIQYTYLFQLADKTV